MPETDRPRGPSPHLSWAELACRDGTPYPREWRATRARDLAEVFERVRAIWNRPIRVGSAYRTPAHNRRVGGARRSQHLQGRALDLYPPRGVRLATFQEAVRLLADQMADEGRDLVGGLGYYPTFLHVDTRGGVGDRLIVWWGARPRPEEGP